VLKIWITTTITQKTLSHSSIIITHSSIIIIKTSWMQTQQRTTQTLHHLAAEEEEIKTQNPNNMEAIKVAMLATRTREGLLVNSSQVDHPQQVTRSNRMKLRLRIATIWRLSRWWQCWLQERDCWSTAAKWTTLSKLQEAIVCWWWWWWNCRI